MITVKLTEAQFGLLVAIDDTGPAKDHGTHVVVVLRLVHGGRPPYRLTKLGAERVEAWKARR